jgi:hypothetical protein
MLRREQIKEELAFITDADRFVYRQGYAQALLDVYDTEFEQEDIPGAKQ